MAKLIEVDEDEYNRSRRVYETLGKIARHPQGAKLLEQAHKTVDPDVPTPLLDADKKVSEPYEALKKDFEDYRKAQDEKASKAELDAKQGAFEARWRAGQQKLLTRGYTDAAVKQFEEQMAAAGVTDHELFADAWEKRNPPAPPAMPGGSGGWNFIEQAAPEGDPSAEFVKKLIETKGQQDFIADKAANMALAEFRQGQPRR